VAAVAADLRAAGLPASFADRLAAAEIGVASGHADRITTSVLELTGRPPRTFTDFVREHAGEWAAPAVAG
jgi:hypothetical protein